MEGQERFQQMIGQSRRIVFFGGAGVSTESGVPDYRSKDGLYNQQFDYPPEVMLSHSFYKRCPEEFFRFYKEKMLCLKAQPNRAHRKLAELEQAGRLSAVITQNIDGLHQAAGSKEVLELHGTVHKNTCESCGAVYDAWHVQQSQGIPRCACGGIVKPDVVLYEESLNQQVIAQAVERLRQADMLIIGGTSLRVYPAASLVDYYQGDRLVLINRSPNGADKRADLCVYGKIGEILDRIKV